MYTETTDIAAKKEPRLDPIEQPDTLKMKLIYWLAERKMGKVITPLKVLYARFPESLGLAKELVDMKDKFTIDPELRLLIQTYIATLNGCAFCIDIAKAFLKNLNGSRNKLDQLLRFSESDLFTDAEKTALSYAEEATKYKQVEDATFEQMKRYFNEQEIVEITMINAIENYYNLMNAPLNIGSDELCEPWN